LRFAADFERHCDGATVPIVGSIRVNSTRGSVLPFDGAYPRYGLTIVPPMGGRVSAAGIECSASGGPDCDETYSAGGPVTGTAQPDAGYLFAGWTGDCSGSSKTTLTVYARLECGAVFDRAPGGSGPLSDDLRLGALLIFGQQGDPMSKGLRQARTRIDTAF